MKQPQRTWKRRRNLPITSSVYAMHWARATGVAGGFRVSLLRYGLRAQTDLDATEITAAAGVIGPWAQAGPIRTHIDVDP